MTISDRIFERLSTMGMTQKQFAEESGLMQSTISEWKRENTDGTTESVS